MGFYTSLQLPLARQTEFHSSQPQRLRSSTETTRDRTTAAHRIASTIEEGELIDSIWAIFVASQNAGAQDVDVWTGTPSVVMDTRNAGACSGP